MKACSSCGCYCRSGDTACPHCGVSMVTSGSSRRTTAALLLGLAIGLNGCPMQSKYGLPDTGAQAEYGVPDTSSYADADDDGWTIADGDCNDDDDTIHPEAVETAGDGVDSNCNDDDDT